MDNERVIVYIDGFNLYFGMKENEWRRYYWLNICELAKRLLKEHQELVAVRYFTSRISAGKYDRQKKKRQDTYIEALQTLEQSGNLSIKYGHYILSKVPCHKCKTFTKFPKEKKTDVNIATEMLVDAFFDKFDTALLVSGDADLTGPVTAIRENLKKKVIAVFPQNRFNKELADSANGFHFIDRRTLAKSQLKPTIRKPDGYVLRRPSEWR